MTGGPVRPGTACGTLTAMRRILGAAVSAALTASTVAGCSSDPVRDSSSDVPFTPCSAADCTGTLPSGAEFDIIMPEDWNGTLAIYSHRLDGPGAPAGVPPETAVAPTKPPRGLDDRASDRRTTAPKDGEQASGAKDNAKEKKDNGAGATSSASPTAVAPPTEPRPGGPELAPLWGEGDRSLADTMLQAGYAVAGATPVDQGWVVSQQVTAAEELHEYFTSTIGPANRVYVWGESTGGLASARLAELHPDWVSGALAMCAPLSGPIQSYNLALDVTYAIRETLSPRLKLVGFTSEDEARRSRDIALRAVLDAAGGSLAAQGRVAFIAAIGELPNASRTDDGLSWQSQLRANVASIRNLVEQATLQRFVLEQRAGGNFSGNAGTDYPLRISDARREQLDGIKKGLTDDLLGRLVAGVRVTPDPAAEARAAEQGTLEGTLEVPTVTLHNAVDPVYIAPNVSAYRAVLAGTGEPEAIGNLVDVFALPAGSVSESSPAQEGIGNCDFEPRTVLGAMIQLNQWVRNDQYPGRDTVAQSFKGRNVTLDYDPGPWPQMSPVVVQDGPVPSETAPPASAGPGGDGATPSGTPTSEGRP